MAVPCMKRTEPRLYHVWPGRKTDAWNMHGLVDSCIQWVDLCMYRTCIMHNTRTIYHSMNMCNNDAHFIPGPVMNIPCTNAALVMFQWWGQIMGMVVLEKAREI